MDTRAYWEIGIGLGGLLLGGAINFFIGGYRVGKVMEIVTRIDAEQARASNRDLRIFQAIEQLRRLHKTGNGIEWVDLVGGN